MKRRDVNQSVLFEPTVDDVDVSDGELDDMLWSFYCSALTSYSRLQALLLLAHVSGGGCVARAHELHALGFNSQAIASEFGTSHTSVLRWLRRSIPKRSEWCLEALEELREYTQDEVEAELDLPSWDGWFGTTTGRAKVGSQLVLFQSRQDDRSAQLPD